jgi:hypothetical protein
MPFTIEQARDEIEGILNGISLGYTLDEINIEDEFINVTLSKYKFFVKPTTKEVEGIGNRTYERQCFELSTWDQTPGGRWHPPEDYDVELGTFDFISQVVTKMITAIVSDEVENLAAFLHVDRECEPWP